MRTAQIFFLLAACLFGTHARTATAQQPASTEAPAPTPPAVDSNGFPDIESLREPGSSAKLFPNQPPAAPDRTQPQATRGANREGQGGLLDRPRRSGRRRNASAEQAAADPLQVRVAYRRAKTLVMVRNPDLAELLQSAAHAGTDPEKRAFLKQYYVRLYAAVAKVNSSPEMKRHLDALRQASLVRYEPKRSASGREDDDAYGRGGGGRGGGRRR